jgi:hypothetical protein
MMDWNAKCPNCGCRLKKGNLVYFECGSVKYHMFTDGSETLADTSKECVLKQLEEAK